MNALLICVLFSCGKDSVNDDNFLNNQLTTIESRSINISVVNGMLKFDDFADVKQTTEDLLALEQDTLIQDSLYNNIGIDSADLASGVFYTTHPACVAFERTYNFSSLRSIEEDEIISSLNEDTQVFSIVKRPYLKVILNGDSSVMIGKRIYKLLNTGFIAAVTNSDWTTYNEINEKPHLEVVDRHNLRLVGTESELFDYVGENITENLVTNLRVRQVVNSDSTVTLINESFVEYSSSQPHFTWVYPDNTTYVGLNPDKNFAPLDTVKLQVRASANDPMDDEIEIEIRDCLFTPMVLELGCSLFLGSDISNILNIEWVEWTLPDNSTTNDVAILYDLNNISVPSQIQYCIKLDFYNGPCCTTIDILPCDFECDLREEQADTDDLFFSNGEHWVVDCLVWVTGSGPFDWFTPGEVGARTKTYKVESNGNLTRTDPEAAFVSCHGDYFDVDEDCEIYSIHVNRPDNTGDSDIQINHDHHGARKYPDELYSEHCITSGGQELCYNGPNGKLVLD